MVEDNVELFDRLNTLLHSFDIDTNLLRNVFPGLVNIVSLVNIEGA